MIKAMMIIWLGAGNTQSIAIDHFDTQFECETAKHAIVETGWGMFEITVPANSIKCIPYGFSKVDGNALAN